MLIEPTDGTYETVISTDTFESLGADNSPSLECLSSFGVSPDGTLLHCKNSLVEVATGEMMDEGGDDLQAGRLQSSTMVGSQCSTARIGCCFSGPDETLERGFWVLATFVEVLLGFWGAH